MYIQASSDPEEASPHGNTEEAPSVPGGSMPMTQFSYKEVAVVVAKHFGQAYRLSRMLIAKRPGKNGDQSSLPEKRRYNVIALVQALVSKSQSTTEVCI